MTYKDLMLAVLDGKVIQHYTVIRKWTDFSGAAAMKLLAESNGVETIESFRIKEGQDVCAICGCKRQGFFKWHKSDCANWK